MPISIKQATYVIKEKEIKICVYSTDPSIVF